MEGSTFAQHAKKEQIIAWSEVFKCPEGVRDLKRASELNGTAEAEVVVVGNDGRGESHLVNGGGGDHSLHLDDARLD